MSVTAIFSDMGDLDCQHLVNLWTGFPDAKVIHVHRTSKNISKDVVKALLDEDDTLIMCGHGTPSGLLNPSMYEFGHIINANNANFIHANRVVALWCYAKRFGKKMGLPGFWSDMFISNVGEAQMNGIRTNDSNMIAQGCITYCKNVNKLLHDNVPLSEWKDILVSQEDMTNPVHKFNYDGLEFLG